MPIRQQSFWVSKSIRLVDLCPSSKLFFEEYIWLTLGTHHFVVRHGVRDIVSRLSRHVPHIHLSNSIVSIEPDPSDSSKLSIRTTTRTYSGFSHLILATQANSGYPLLSSYYSSLPEDSSEHGRTVRELIRCLQSFQYRRTVVINHTDDTFLPPDKRDRRDLNLVTQPKWASDEKQQEEEQLITVPRSYTMATHVLYTEQSDCPIYQTTNPIVPPRRDSILSVAVLERAIVTVESKGALSRLSVRNKTWRPFVSPSSSLGDLQGAGRLKSPLKPGIWVCGSYAYAGIPLLEGCVVSAKDVVEQGVLRCEGVIMQDALW